jgi:phosphoribosylformimino-5-aminoimidazole carboxamide ribotide isomerase
MCAYTDIQRDGGQGGLNLESTRHFAQGTGLTVIASGGVGSLEDVRAARLDGLSGVIIGRALYEGRIDLNEALAC